MHSNILTLDVNFLEQSLISFNLITLLGCYCGKIELEEILNCMSCISKSPVEGIEATTEINYLTFIVCFLESYKFDKSALFINDAFSFSVGKKVTVK